jgi:hypothetical protein
MGVTVRDQIDFTTRFFDECLAIMQSKGLDYAPKGIALSEAWWTAAETNTTPELSIYNAMRKHWGAVQTAVRTGNPLHAESLRNHLTDIANFAVLMAFVIDHKKDFYAALTHWCEQNPCTGRHAGDDPCDTCQMLDWLYPRIVELEC